jgi:DNA-directed RNA polymerase subunit RPC12/RpoP
MSRNRFSFASVLILAFVAYLILAVLLIVVAAPSALTITLLLAVALILVLLVRWHARSTVYQCPACGHRFRISGWTDFVHPHGGDKKYLRCPGCGKSDWCKEIESDTT